MKKLLLGVCLVLTSCNFQTKEVVLVESFPIKDSKDCVCTIKFIGGDSVEAIDKKCRLRKSSSVGDTILVDFKIIQNER